ncbi:MAG: 3-isopropylmalate dehydrogenase [uncultured Thermomicrobiales bacterium]|uniref:3-isopropylmalate dehydrogenase n=1 Tax=uncultured Thermomicrobiales bacterium TaxID=1645740 RepID=A0A6J4V9W9_9BACT|nr:MAG: 3-isopropylmalate dehydrogenase [uncultured Thermomicrobiales bacterium]
MAEFTVARFAGDGVGPEVMAEADKVLSAVGGAFGHRFRAIDLLLGGAAIDRYGVPLRGEDAAAAAAADAILLGAVGGPAWDSPTRAVRPEQGLLALRKRLGLYANLRPVALLSPLVDASPLKGALVEGVDLLVVRELTGGIYFGRPSRRWRERRGRAAVDTLVYREHEIVRVVRLAFDLARTRRRRLASIDKANVLESSRLWRTVVSEIAADYPDVDLEHVLVDAMAMHLVRNPARFDVVVTENMFGDILTDEASVIAGSIGLLPSASLGAAHAGANGRRLGLYEPIHGSAPDIAGQNRANPIGMILSAALLLRWSLGLEREAVAVETAVADAVAAGALTADLVTVDHHALSTSAMGDAVAGRVQAA